MRRPAREEASEAATAAERALNFGCRGAATRTTGRLSPGAGHRADDFRLVPTPFFGEVEDAGVFTE